MASPSPLPRSVIVAQQFRQALAAGEIDAMQSMAHEWRQIEHNISLQLVPLITEIQAARDAGEEISKSKLFERDRYHSLLAQVGYEIDRFNSNTAEQKIGNLQQNAATLGIEGVNEQLRAALVDHRAVGASFTRLSTAATANIVALAQAGQPLGYLLSNAYPAAAAKITDSLVSGVALGVNPRVVARRIARDDLSVGLNHILLVARDQNNRAYREATRAGYKQSGIVDGYRRLAAKNERTCLACLALDGQVYDVDALMPLHPQDRCTMIPIIRGFTPLPVQTGEEWFKKQHPDVQARMMGPGRYFAYRNGKFNFKQLASAKRNDTWGPSAQVTPLSKLLGGKGGVKGVGYQPPLSAAEKAAEKFPEPGKFKDVKQAERWLESAHPNITADFKGAHIDAINPTMAEFDRLARDWPEVAKRLEFVGTYESNKYPVNFSWERDQPTAFAHASRDGKRIAFNPKYYGDPKTFAELKKFARDTKWTIGGTMQSTMTHEFGHQVQFWLSDQRLKALTPVVGSSGEELITTIIANWAENSRTSARHISQYAKTNDAELFAEAFTAWQRGDNIAPAKRLGGLLDYIMGQQWYDMDQGEARWFLDIPRDQRTDTYNRVRKPVLDKLYGFWATFKRRKP